MIHKLEKILCQIEMEKGPKEKGQKQGEKKEIVNKKLKRRGIMPRGDRTGPNGLGPMTGRRMGFCAGNNNPGYMNSGFGYGRGAGYGRGFGRGFGRAGYGRIYSEPLPVQEREYGEPSKAEQLKELKAEKKEIDKAIEELEKKE
jgi:hypothetical protein